jgi:NAD(P)-dependent dehydrogenase (short-subunit alcohol dehydrogenase family)
MTKWTEADIPDLHGKRALVTGAASGLGFATAAALARKGAHVIVADRNVEGGKAAVERIRELAPGASVEFKALDLADLSFIRRFAKEVVQTGAALDVLINNAGILPPLQRATTRDGFELKFGINHLGHFALTGLLLDALLRSPAPRVVSISSLVQAYGRIDFDDLQAEHRYEPQRAYNQAKLACLAFALELNSRSAALRSKLISLAAHPGVARTAIGDNRRQEQSKRLRDRLEYMAMKGAMKFFGQSSDRGALPILYAATSPDAVGGGFYGPNGTGQMSGYPKRVKPSASALDPVIREQLWSISERLTNVNYSRLRSVSRLEIPHPHTTENP